jgi:Zn-finger nucleic acid-binding protein
MTAFRDSFVACPRCRATLERSGSVWACVPCRGFWVEEGILEEMMRAMRPALEGHGRRLDTSPRVDHPPLPCPQCTEPLAAVALEEIPVDRCPRQHGVWFDADELEHALRNASAAFAPLDIFK